MRRLGRHPCAWPSMKPQVYKDPRPAEYFDAVPRAPRARASAGPTPSSASSSRCRRCCSTAPGRSGSRTCRKTGPLILAPNHFSQMDHFFAGVYLRRKVRFMAKSQLFGPPGPHLHLQARRRLPGPPRPPRRGGLQDRLHAPRPGRDAAVYAEGGRSRSGELGEPKPGIGRIALESGVPVVPVAIHGSASVRRWKRLRFPKVTVQFGEPLDLPGRGRRRAASASSRSRTRSSTRSQMYVALEERRDVLRRWREIRAGPRYS